jgi:hypothetical protein
MPAPVHLVLLFTGGQDSLLAAAILRAVGCEVTGLYFETLTGCGRHSARERAAELHLPLRIVSAASAEVDRFSAAWGHTDRLANPCAVCRTGLLQAAGRAAAELGADGVATGEVLGQRPGQGRMELLASAAAAGLHERVLRPLCAKLLPPTELERSGLIDRERLGELTSRGRKGQQALAARLGLGSLPAPGEDCPLLQSEFAARARDLIAGATAPTAQEFALLRLGRHFRYSPGAKVIVGRNAAENDALSDWLTQSATPALLLCPTTAGPTALVCGEATDGAVRFAAGLIARFARWSAEQPVEFEVVTAQGRELRSIRPDPASWQATPVGSHGRQNG